MIQLRNWIFILAFTFTFSNANAFVFNDVRVQGLQRVSAGTVFGSIPFNTGDDIDELDVRLIVQSLFETGSFDDVQVGRDGDVLVIIVNELSLIHI